VKSLNDEHLKNYGNLIFAPATPEEIFRENGCFLGERLEFTRFLLAQDPSSFDAALIKEHLPDIMHLYAEAGSLSEQELHIWNEYLRVLSVIIDPKDALSSDRAKLLESMQSLTDFILHDSEEKTFATERRALCWLKNFLCALQQLDEPIKEYTMLPDTVRSAVALLREKSNERVLKIRSQIKDGTLKPDDFLALFTNDTNHSHVHQFHSSHDEKDFLFREILGIDAPLTAQNQRSEGELYFSATPLREVIHLIQSEQFCRSDVIVDLGSGDGVTALFIHLATGAHVIGIELDKKLCARATNLIKKFNLSHAITCKNDNLITTELPKAPYYILASPLKGKPLAILMQKLLPMKGSVIFPIYHAKNHLDTYKDSVQELSRCEKQTFTQFGRIVI
jgi:protein-L-isoaspartate O-methyltransferase